MCDISSCWEPRRRRSGRGFLRRSLLLHYSMRQVPWRIVMRFCRRFQSLVCVSFSLRGVQVLIFFPIIRRGAMHFASYTVVFWLIILQEKKKKILLMVNKGTPILQVNILSHKQLSMSQAFSLTPMTVLADQCDLTQSTERVLRFMRDYFRTTSNMPTIREIMRYLGFRSTNSVYKQIKKLEACGAVRKTTGGKLQLA
ncbi:hypothetical protein COW46_03345 [Candidatus Gracilibacteria bacterium CG17_big_fil_post_rev_8_21_14_2_50_48_13]|nr:MAG: hypothetical protein COW46_03345 [Candidatus Gracilibacteria bacterium CG17_big_fil_post_rev_8_21_14_2_50_48_13]